MNKYLEGYLSSVPQSEYINIINFLQKYASKKFNMSEEEFENLIANLVDEHEPTTKAIKAKPDEKPKDTYNKFFSGISIDLLFLFKIIDALYNAIDSYSYLSASYFSDIKAELDKLDVKVRESKAKREYDSNTIIITENFKTTQSFEDYNESTKRLFCDRDDIENKFPLPLVNIVHNNTDDFITLSVKEEKDLLHNTEGKTIGTIEVIDYRGVPTDTYYGPSQAIDNSDTSYWDCTTYSIAPINTPMDDLESGGALIKFRVRLSNTNKISEISLTPFCIFPLNVCKIQIDNTDIISSLANPLNSSTETMTFNFYPISADEIEITLRQKNYLYDIINTNAKEDEANELWNAASNVEKLSYVNQETTPSEYKEENVYNKYMQRKEKEIDLWNKNYIKEKE